MRKISRFFTTLLLAAVATAGLFAQELPQADAGRALSTTVGYTAQKSARMASLSDEQKTQIAALEKAYAAAGAARNYGEAMKIVHHAMSVLAGNPYTPLRALSYALVAKADHALLEPSQTVTLKVGEWYALDEQPAGKLAAAVVVVKAGSLDPIGAPLKTLEVAPADLAKAATLSVAVPDVPDGNYTLAVVFKSTAEGAESLPIRATVSVRVARGLAGKVAALRARLAKTQPADPSAEYRAVLYGLVDSGEVPPGRIDFDAEITEANAILDAAAAKKDVWASRKGDMRKAYLSGVDKTLQPYRVFVPSTYDGSKAFPLVIALHGMGGDENSMFDGYNQAVKNMAEKHGYLVACPKGRAPASMYMGTAEKDVLDVLDEMKRAYRVDSDRIFLTGHSMGGYGTWSLSQSHPEIFAALAPIAGGGSVAGMAKIAKIPQIVIHGDADGTVNVERSREMVAAGKAAGAEILYKEIPGGSHTSIAAPAFPDIFDFFDAHPKKPVTGGN